MTISEVGNWVESIKAKVPSNTSVEEKALALTIAKVFKNTMVGELVFDELKPYFCKPGDTHWGSLLN